MGQAEIWFPPGKNNFLPGKIYSTPILILDYHRVEPNQILHTWAKTQNQFWKWAKTQNNFKTNPCTILECNPCYYTKSTENWQIGGIYPKWFVRWTASTCPVITQLNQTCIRVLTCHLNRSSYEVHMRAGKQIRPFWSEWRPFSLAKIPEKAQIIRAGTAIIVCTGNSRPKCPPLGKFQLYMLTHAIKYLCASFAYIRPLLLKHKTKFHFNH